jgi:hypothetical protein
MKNIFLRFFVIVVLFLFTSCGIAEEGAVSNSDVVVQDNVVVLDNMDVPSMSLTLQKTPSFKVGDVLVGKADGGFVKRVLSITENQDGTYNVETEDATLEDVFVDSGGDFGIYYESDFQDLSSVNQLCDSLDLFNALGFKKTIAFNFSQKVVQDPNTGSALYVNGDIKTAPDFYFDAKIKWMKFQNVTFKVTGDVDMNLTLIADGKIGASSGDVQIASFGFTPLVIMVGPIPLTFVPVINLYVGAQAYTQGIATFNINEHVDYNLGSVFDGKRWNDIKDIQNFPAVFTKDIYVGADGKVWFKAAFGLRIMRASTLQVSASPYARFHWEALTPPPNWFVYEGFTSDVEFLMKVLSWNIVDWKQVIWQKEWILYQY